MRVLVTGAAGFIGFHLSRRLLDLGHDVTGYDSINDYYDPKFKYHRLSILNDYRNFSFTQGKLEDEQVLRQLWVRFNPSHVVHLAAQAGVRYSIENPLAYINSNIVGFQNVIELVRQTRPENFIYASSSSVYGGNKVLPFSESHDVRDPVSLYAVTKLSNELVAKAYGNLFQIPSTGLRFFTVYGPYGRPDMAMFKFASALTSGQPLSVFNSGQMVRDFTYIDDIVDGILACMSRADLGQVYNLGRGKREVLLDMINILAGALGRESILKFLPMQLGDVEETAADISKARQNLGYEPRIDISEGIPRFAAWYQGLPSELLLQE